MQLNERAEEILETLWILRTEKGEAKSEITEVLQDICSHGAIEAPAAQSALDSDIKTLLEAKLIEMPEGDKSLALTAAGEERGREIIRQHRLAERLLADVLDVSEAAGDEAACRFEHILKRGLDERVCTLLGHPHFCPHGLAIPPGKCCEEKRRTSVRIVAPLSELEDGESGTIAYVHTKERKHLDRLMALGVLPGEKISLLQRFPSFVFQVGETQVAVDADLAARIFIRLGERRKDHRRWRRRGIFGR